MLLVVAVARAAVIAVAHHGVATGEGIAWTSTVVTDGRERVGLVFPLAAGRAVEGAEALEDDGRIVAFDLHDRVTTIRVTQPNRERLEPPLLATGAVQRVSLQGLRYTPARALGFEQHLGYTVHPEIDATRRRAHRRAAGGGGAHPLYLYADDRVVRAGGLAGEVVPATTTPLTTTIGVAVAFAVALGALGVALRVLSRHARRLDREAYVREEFVRPK